MLPVSYVHAACRLFVDKANNWQVACTWGGESRQGLTHLGWIKIFSHSILYYIIYFFLLPVLATSVWGPIVAPEQMLGGDNRTTNRCSQCGSHGKAWHIWGTKRYNLRKLFYYICFMVIAIIREAYVTKHKFPFYFYFINIIFTCK